jgi:hypothetical protein
MRFDCRSSTSARVLALYNLRDLDTVQPSLRGANGLKASRWSKNFQRKGRCQHPRQTKHLSILCNPLDLIGAPPLVEAVKFFLSALSSWVFNSLRLREAKATRRGHSGRRYNRHRSVGSWMDSAPQF